MVCIVFYGVNILNIHFCYFYFGNGKLYDKILKGEYFIFSLRNIDKSFDNIFIGLDFEYVKIFQGYLNLQLFVTKGINILTM